MAPKQVYCRFLWRAWFHTALATIAWGNDEALAARWRGEERAVEGAFVVGNNRGHVPAAGGSRSTRRGRQRVARVSCIQNTCPCLCSAPCARSAPQCGGFGATRSACGLSIGAHSPSAHSTLTWELCHPRCKPSVLASASAPAERGLHMPQGMLAVLAPHARVCPSSEYRQRVKEDDTHPKWVQLPAKRPGRTNNAPQLMPNAPAPQPLRPNQEPKQRNKDCYRALLLLLASPVLGPIPAPWRQLLLLLLLPIGCCPARPTVHFSPPPPSHHPTPSAVLTSTIPPHTRQCHRPLRPPSAAWACARPHRSCGSPPAAARAAPPAPWPPAPGSPAATSRSARTPGPACRARPRSPPGSS